MIDVSCQASRSHLQTMFWPINEFARDEVHLSVHCLPVMPHLARLSRLCRGQPRPCSRRVPPRRAVVVFSRFFFWPQVSVRTYRYLPGIRLSSAGSSLSLLISGRWFKSRKALVLNFFSCVIFFFCHFSFCLAPCALSQPCSSRICFLLPPVRRYFVKMIAAGSSWDG